MSSMSRRKFMLGRFAAAEKIQSNQLVLIHHGRTDHE